MDKLDADLERVRARAVEGQDMSPADAVGRAYAGHPWTAKAGASSGSGNDNLVGDLNKEITAPIKAPAI